MNPLRFQRRRLSDAASSGNIRKNWASPVQATTSPGLAVFPGSSIDRVLQWNSKDANFSTTVQIFPLLVVFVAGRFSAQLSSARDRPLAKRLFVPGRK